MAYRKSPTLFRMVRGTILDPSYAHPFPKLEIRNPHPKLQPPIISGTGKATDSNFVRIGLFTGSIGTKAHDKFWEIHRGCSQKDQKIFRPPIYGGALHSHLCAHRFLVKLIFFSLTSALYNDCYSLSRGSIQLCEGTSKYVSGPSVRPSVTSVDCDHTRWNSAKIIQRLISLGTWLSVDTKITDLLQREHP